MKNKSFKAGSDHHEEHPESLPPDVPDEPQGTVAVSGEESARVLRVESPVTGSAKDVAAGQSGREEIDQASVGGSREMNTAQANYRHKSSKRRRSLSSLKRKLDHANRTIRYQRIGLLSVIALIVLVVISIRVSVSNKERNMEYQLNQKSIEIMELRSTVEDQRANIDSFLGERLPGLIDMEFDRVFEVDHPYVRNITFANIRTARRNEYEFRIVLENDTPTIAAPVIDVLLFDELGLEIDRRKLRNRGGDNVIAIAPLSHGDVHSYVDSFLVLADTKPSYFLVR